METASDSLCGTPGEPASFRSVVRVSDGLNKMSAVEWHCWGACCSERCEELSGGWRQSRNEELHSVKSFCVVIKTRKMRLAGYATSIAKDTCCI
jgi:hypothetical protein